MRASPRQKVPYGTSPNSDASNSGPRQNVVGGHKVVGNMAGAMSADANSVGGSLVDDTRADGQACLVFLHLAA